jgi:hypothetical protein
MKNANSFNVDKYNKYLEFINECKTKNYDSKLVLHKHHIIPKHICADELLLNSDENIVKLSVEDHANAHLLFAEMYEVGTYEHSSNLRSARIIGKKSIRDVDTLEKISKTYVGDKNPFYGKTHTEETRKKLSMISPKYRAGKTYEEIYGKERADEEKLKRAKKTRTDDEYKEAGKNISKKLKGMHSGDKNPFAQPYLVDGVYFGSKKSVELHYNKKLVTIKKYHNVEKIDRKKKHEYSS